jgi:hypothetical protein
MKRTLCIIATLSAAATASAWIMPAGTGARPAAMQFAVTALADDVYCTAINPAALAALEGREAGLDFARLFWGLSDESSLVNGFAGYAQRFPNIGTIGIAWRHFSLAGYYTENLLSAGIGRTLPWYGIRAGAALKVGFLEYGRTPYTQSAVNLETGQQLNGTDPVFSAGYGTAWFTMDIGALYAITPEHTVGLAINDLIPPNIGIAAPDTRSANARIGYALRNRLLTGTADVVIDADSMALNLGAEKMFALGSDAFIGVRCGFGAGTLEYYSAALGASYRYGSLVQFDYAFRYPLNGIGTFGSHQFSCTLKM